MTFDLTPTAAQHDLARRAHEFAESLIRPVEPVVRLAMKVLRPPGK